MKRKKQCSCWNDKQPASVEKFSHAGLYLLQQQVKFLTKELLMTMSWFNSNELIYQTLSGQRGLRFHQPVIFLGAQLCKWGFLRGMTEKDICVSDKKQEIWPCAKEQCSCAHNSSLQSCYPVNTFHSLRIVITEVVRIRKPVQLGYQQELNIQRTRRTGLIQHRKKKY